DAQGRKSSPADCERVGRPDAVQTERPRYTRCKGEGALRGMIEASRPHGGDLTKTALHLIGHRQSGQEISPAAIGVFSSGQYGTQVVTRMAGFALGQITIVEVEVAHQRAI